VSAPARADFRALGTGCVVVVDDETALDAARERVDAELALIDRTCSRFRDDSELSVLNRASADTMAVSDTLAAAIAVALRGAELTGGDLDPTLGSALRVLGYDRDFGAVAPNAGAVMKVRVARNWRRLRIDPTTRTVTRPAGVEIDLGATAKAWAADRAAAAAATVARCGVLVSLGGDIATAGPPPVEGWSVRVTDSHAASVDAPGITVAIHSGGLATSSTTARRWQRGNMVLHHIIDPETSQPAREVWRTVSVVAQHCVDANIASTTAIIRGDRALEWFQDVRLPARLVAVDGHVVTCNGWPDDGTAS
jgi:thiamine biosynthesis lipoprotein ApbE